MGLLPVLWFPPTFQKHVTRWTELIRYSKSFFFLQHCTFSLNLYIGRYEPGVQEALVLPVPEKKDPVTLYILVSVQNSRPMSLCLTKLRTDCQTYFFQCGWTTVNSAASVDLQWKSSNSEADPSNTGVGQESRDCAVALRPSNHVPDLAIKLGET